jgi:uncharacterized membrane protein
MAASLRYGRWVLFGALALAYAFLAHYTNSRPNMASLGTAIALAPILLAGLSLAWHANHRKAALGLFALACVGLLFSWDKLERHYSLIYWIEHAGTELILCLVFARTLRCGREPMCTYFARMVHGSLSPGLAHYTRWVTVAWVGFFAVMALISTLLFVATPIATWSVFANFFTAPLICLMFVAEYAVRKRLLPQVEHAHIMDGIKAFWKEPAR